MSKTLHRAIETASLPFDEKDPIFTAIDRHRAAMAAFSDAVDSLAMLLPGPKLDAANAITARKSEELDNAGVELVNVQPTTFAGLIALLSHIGECLRSENGEPWRLPDMVLFEGKLRPAEFLEPSSEGFAYFAMFAVANTIRRLVTGRRYH